MMAKYKVVLSVKGRKEAPESILAVAKLTILGKEHRYTIITFIITQQPDQRSKEYNSKEVQHSTNQLGKG